MNEGEFAVEVVERLNGSLKNGLVAETEKPLNYTHHIYGYHEDGTIDNGDKFKTDILIYETDNEMWVPRVVIETKLGRISTHAAITYSNKAATHKFVHPYLRYGILIGSYEKGLPGRLLKHGEFFDFMVCFEKDVVSDDEFKKFVALIRKEIQISQKLQTAFRDNRKHDRTRYSSLHRQIVFEEK